MLGSKTVPSEIAASAGNAEVSPAAVKVFTLPDEDRRRPGRRAEVSAELLPLLRGSVLEVKPQRPVQSLKWQNSYGKLATDAQSGSLDRGGSTNGQALDKGTSLYLDIVRISAAMLVFLSHMSGKRFTGGFLWPLNAYGGQRVTIFIVLSGFVVAFLVGTRETTARAFFVNRAARLYSVVIPALILTAVLDILGFHLRPDLYLAWPGYLLDHQFEQFLRAATFTNMTWGADGGPGSNSAFWTLGLEGFYYLAFGLAVFGNPAWRILAVLAVAALAGPTALELAPVWLAGVVAYHVAIRVELSPAASLAFLTVPVLVWATYLALTMGLPPPPRLSPQDMLPWTYAVALLFGAHLVGARGVMPRLGGLLLPLARPIRWCAGASFSIYLFHMPIAQFLTTVTPWQPGEWQNRVLMIGGTLVAVFVLAEVTERRREPWRRFFGRIAAMWGSSVKLDAGLAVATKASPVAQELTPPAPASLATLRTARSPSTEPIHHNSPLAEQPSNSMH